MSIFVTFNTSCIEKIVVKSFTPCTKCGDKNYSIQIKKLHITSLPFMSITRVVTEVYCSSCQVKLSKKLWPHEVQSIAETKKQQYNPSWLQRGGKMLLLVIATIAVIAGILFNQVLESNKLKQNALSNFAEAYDADIKNQWYQNLQAGDFIIANKNYYDPAQVFKINHIDAEVVVLDAFDQYIPRDEYRTLPALNQLTFGQGSSQQYKVKRKYFIKGILEEVSDNIGGPNNAYIQQIKKQP